MPGRLISTVSMLARQMQANQLGIKYIGQVTKAATKFYQQIIKPTALEEIGDHYEQLEREKIGKTQSEVARIEERQEWLIKTGKKWKKKPF